jgi:hypothetical protein
MAASVVHGLSIAGHRRFGVSVGAALALLGALLAWRGLDTAALVLAVGGALLAGAGLAMPARLESLHHAWLRVALLLSRVTTPLLLTAFYFLVLTPSGLIRRRFQGPLSRPAGADTYWVSRASRQSDLRRQF